jgi:hypothetical protein
MKAKEIVKLVKRIDTPNDDLIAWKKVFFRLLSNGIVQSKKVTCNRACYALGSITNYGDWFFISNVKNASWFEPKKFIALFPDYKVIKLNKVK